MRTSEEWMVEIDNALHFREEFGREEKWDELEKMYMHDPSSNTAIGPNLIYSHGDSLMSSLTVPDPEFLVAPETRFGVQSAPIVERLDNQLMRKCDVKKSVDRAILNAYLYGKPILKVGYDSLYGFSPYYDLGNQKQFLGMTLTQFDKKGRRLEFGNQRPGWPWVRPVMPQDFVVPWGTVELGDARWVAQRFVRRVDDMKRDPKYKNTSRLEGDMSMEDFMKSYQTIGSRRMKYNATNDTAYMANKEPAYREFWEIRDAEENKIIVVSRDYDKPLRNDVDAIMIAIGQVPYVTGELVMHPRSFWTTPLAYYLGQIQATQFDIAMQTEKQRRLSVLRFLVRKGVLTEDALTRIMSSDVGGYVETEDIPSSQSLRDVVATMPTGQLLDLALQAEHNRRDARDMVGFSRNQLGEFDASSRRTAREATFVQQGSEQRSGKRIEMISDLYLNVMRLFNNMIFEFWRTPRDVLIENGWTSVTGPMIKSDYAYDLTLTTKRHLSKSARKIEALQVMMQMAQFPGANLPELYQFFLNAANDPSFERLLPASGSNQGGRSPSGGLPTIPGSA